MNDVADIRTTATARVREAGFRLMCVRPINAALRSAVRPLASRLPWGVVHSIPMIGEIEVDLPDGRRIVLVSDGYDSLASRMYWSGIDGFEPESLRLFLHLAASADTVLDVGAHIGLYALLAAAGRPEVTAVAFEPVGRNAGSLRANVARNGVANVVVEEVAVGGAPGTVALHVPDTLRLPATASMAGNGAGGGAPVEVPLVSIDSYVDDNGLGPIDLIKIDVEGGENAVLRGAAATIRRHRPSIICEVLHGIGDTRDSMAVFAGTDYRFFLITGAGLVEHDELVGDPSYYHKNYLLIPDSAMDRLPAGSIVEPAST